MTTSDLAAPQLPWEAADPFPFYEQRRQHGTIVWDDSANAWLALGYHAARTVLSGQHWTSDPRTTANGLTGVFNSVFVEASMLFTDGTVHRRLRDAVRDVFSRNFITGLDAGIDAICQSVLDAVDPGEPVDVMSQIALPLPIAVIGAWLGLDSRQCAALRDNSASIVRLLGGFTDESELHDGLAAAASLIAELLPATADRRAHPADDLLSYIAAGPLTLDEAVVTTVLIAVAGHETTANLLGTSLIRLLTPNADGIRLADRIDPSDPRVLTELLRLDGPIQAVGRTATREQYLDGVRISCGETVLVCPAAANRDPAVFDDPAGFRLDRGPAPLSFGHGAHFCLGAPLARLETAAALTHILRRQSVLDGMPTWRDTPAIRGPLAVPVRFRT